MNIETKYRIGEELWFMSNNLPQSDVVNTINLLKTTEKQNVEYSFKNYKRSNGNGHPYFKENTLFKTKEELLKSL